MPGYQDARMVDEAYSGGSLAVKDVGPGRLIVLGPLGAE